MVTGGNLILQHSFSNSCFSIMTEEHPLYLLTVEPNSSCSNKEHGLTFLCHERL